MKNIEEKLLCRLGDFDYVLDEILDRPAFLANDRIVSFYKDLIRIEVFISHMLL